VTVEAAADSNAEQGAGVGQLARRSPFTISVVAIMLLLGIATQTLWSPLDDRPLIQVVAYGLPALQDGRWWAPVSGAFFALVPAQYIPVAGGAALLVGWSEWRLGTGRVAVAAVTAHLFAVLGTSAVLLLLSQGTWDWAHRLAQVLDVGFSAGALGAVAAASVTLSAPWRGRVRTLLLLYAVLSLLYIGVLWDIEHFLAVVFGLAIGPFLVGRRPQPPGLRMTRHEWRITAFWLFLISAVVRVILYFTPSDGPLGATTVDFDATAVIFGAAISVLLANGLRKGSRRVWQLAGALTTLALGFGVLLLLIELFSPDRLNGAGQVVSSVPELAVDVVLWSLQLGVIVAGRSAFRAPPSRAGALSLAGMTDRDAAVELLKTHGGSTMSWMGTWPANNWFVVRDDAGTPTGYIAFQTHRGVAIGLGDPVATDRASREGVLRAFVDDRESHGELTCFFSVTQEVAAWARATGRRDVVVAEEAIIDLPTLEFRGKQWQNVRTALNRAAKEGITYREGRLAAMPRGIVSQVRAISEVWVGDKGLPEMGFTLGGIDEALDPDTVVGLAVDADSEVHGITSWLPVYSPGGRVRGWTLDVMRRLPEGFKPVTEFLIASACLSFQQGGAEIVSLSGAPLAHAGGAGPEGEPLDRLLGALGEALEPLYGFRSLESFKQRFSPRNEPVFLVFGDEAALPRIGLALTSAYLPGTSMRELALAGLRARRAAEATA
jgi:lysylphosphatidylglycerol synthetase-like protein (DUF2156 family)